MKNRVYNGSLLILMDWSGFLSRLTCLMYICKLIMFLNDVVINKAFGKDVLQWANDCLSEFVLRAFPLTVWKKAPLTSVCLSAKQKRKPVVKMRLSHLFHPT